MDRQKLAEDIEKHIRTTFIGSLAAIEKRLGFLWGIGQDELTDIQKKYLRLWGDLRNEILDFGNHQMRALLKKLEKNEYDV